MKALFRLDTGGKFGLGHLMRSKALADALAKLGIVCTFAVKHIHSDNALLPHQLLFINTEDEFLTYAQSYDVIIVDHYDYSSENFYALSQLSHSILVILDDECNRGPLYADIIINPIANSDLFNYADLAADARLLSGPQYILLRDVFHKVKALPFRARKSIIITFGGSDISNLTLAVLKKISRTKLASEHIIVVSGAACSQVAMIADYCRQHGFEHRHNVADMAALFATAKLAISAAGSTAFELAYSGVPAVFAVVADNQLESIKEQLNHGWCAMVDCRKSNKADELLSLAAAMIQSEKLESYSQLARSLIDGKGAERIALEISQRAERCVQ
ncbi:MAG: UDP-2,4-diacetamido-2,4,6-trideoxy-beta-L-altropyranose hydrolase [Thiotrichaceae bacterium]|nr:UDP-2,4-diacetamido-2,4,6-trideoxy-beta-L-altropyranose hydrolase [Thiotrichaceae bacterium]